MSYKRRVQFGEPSAAQLARDARRKQKREIERVGAERGEIHNTNVKGVKRRLRCIGKPMSKLAKRGHFFDRSMGGHSLSVWEPIPYDNEGRRIIRAKAPK